MERYSAFRRVLARQFRQLSERRLLGGERAIDAICLRIESVIRTNNLGVIPEKYLSVKKYGRTHAVLVQYLAERLGQSVPASRLRVLTGDQIHTERRVRELRD